MAASERWRPPSPVAWLMVSLPERRRSSPPLPRCSRLSSLRSGARLVILPASARAAAACAAAGSSSRAGVWALRAAALRSFSSFALASASLRSRSALRWASSASAASFSARRRSISSLRAFSASASCLARSASTAWAASSALRRRSISASVMPASLPERPAPEAAFLGAPPGLGTMTRLRLRSTVTDLVRPWLKLWRTWLVSVPPPRSPSVLPLPLSLSLMRYLTFPRGAVPPIRRGRPAGQPDFSSIPLRRADSYLTRSPSPPPISAACITRSRPKAKPN